VLESSDKGLSVERLMQGLIIGQALVGKIGGEVVLWIAVALRPRDPNFLTPDPFTQRCEGMHCIVDAVEARLPVRIGLDHGALPLLGHHAIEGDLISVGIKPAALARVWLHEIKGLDHGLVLVIVRLE
jgi:hypothetical protein